MDGAWGSVSMSELNQRSSRLLVDMQACQTVGSGPRGVGRYSHALFSGLAAEAGERDIFAHLATHLPVPVKLDGFPESRMLRSPPLPAWGTNRDFQGGEQDTLDALSLSAFIAPVKADIIHVSHVFEGFGERVALPSISRRAAGQIISATLYDLIPLLFQDHYFKDGGFRKWYMARMAWLRQADLLLAISESSRQDAIALLGIEPWRIVTIRGGISPHFTPQEDPQTLRRELANRYGLRERFVLYTGGDDHRKNIRGAITGYAAVPPHLRKDCQLVIVCSMGDDRKQMYMNEARTAGLMPEDVIIAGFVPEEDLVAFYGTCDLFVFPSLYEGLGLPVLEAMACGAPVIGGNNSSIKELIARPDALFDAASPQSIGAAIAGGLGNKDYAKKLSEYGLVRSKEFTWQRSAKLALEAFDEAIKRSRESGVHCAIQGWLPRKRLAIFTPLPPCRSGIADYNARFLPYLARHFDIDLYVDNYKVIDEMLTSSFRIFNAQDFEAVASQYDAILYEFGNSEFHAYMLPLLERYPGIVGLHDAYLSGLFGYLEYYLGRMGCFHEAMLYSHGPVARRLLAPIQCNPDPIGVSHAELPCTKRVLDNAIGVISHSPFNLEVAHQFYPEGWQAPYRIIPQMVSAPQPCSTQRREATRKVLGFANEDFIITAFGHIVWTKWGDRLLDAFLSSSLHSKSHVHLVFAGELAKDDFGFKLEQAVKKSGIKHRIHITGFLSEQDYEGYLRISDMAIQLRTKSRGGTPKGVLDCLACGLPVVVNNDASYKDYPSNVVIKLSADPSVAEISKVLEQHCFDAGLRTLYYREGLEYVRAQHDPEKCAAEYAVAIHEFAEKHRRTLSISYVPDFAPHLAGCIDSERASQEAVSWFGSVPTPSFAKRRIFLDVSHIAEFDHQSGIQRVVKEITHSFYCSARYGFDPVAVRLEGNALVKATDWLHTRGLLLPHEITGNAKKDVVEFRKGDVLFMLDSSWTRFKEFFPVFEKARSAHVPIYTVVHDLLPIRLPSCFEEGAKEWFEGWLRDAISVSNGLVCVSRTTAEDVISYVKSNPSLSKSPNLKVGYWHHGSDFSKQFVRNEPMAKVAKMATKPYILMVGSIEPRKSHQLALDAMEILWDQGFELCLCIAGKEGWMVSHLMERLRLHPQLGKKLFLFEGPSDADIHFLYSKSSGLFFPSMGEGFGLPLIEAANYGIPIICSDIPVFHEIASRYATYVNISNSAQLAKDLAIWWGNCQKHNVPQSNGMPRLTWEQSAEMLLDVLMKDNWLELI